MKGWSSLGAVETIYEEEDDDMEEMTSSSFSSPSPPITLHSRVEAWTLATGLETNAFIRVQGKDFRLHKEPLTSRSNYLKRQLRASSDLTLSPPLNITEDTFRLVAEYCYGANIIITPSNTVALRIAAELLELTDGNGDEVDGLRLITEVNFRRFLTAGRGEHVPLLFRTSLNLLPESESAAACVSRCAEVVFEIMDGEDDESSGGGVMSCLDYVVAVGVEDFKIMVESVQLRLSNHDILYRMVDIYLQEHGGKLANEDKSQISSCVDCTKLSPDLLIHAVQNPRMPLRFAIRAMLVEQLRTRHTVLRATDCNGRRRPKQTSPAKIISVPTDETTLGGILHRDAALRQAVQLKEAMATTRSRIQSLEEELSSIKQLLLSDSCDREGVDMDKGGGSIMHDSGKRSMSFHYGSSMESRKMERGERRSASSLSCRFTKDSKEAATRMLSSEIEVESPIPKMVRKTLVQKFISGLKLGFGKVSKADAGNYY